MCRDALAILVDCVQLCKVVRGESEACTFNSTCSDIFTGVVMQHLCSQEPSESLPARFLLPVIESELSGGEFKSRNRPPSAGSSVHSVESDGDIFDRVQVLEMVRLFLSSLSNPPPTGPCLLVHCHPLFLYLLILLINLNLGVLLIHKHAHKTHTHTHTHRQFHRHEQTCTHAHMHTNTIIVHTHTHTQSERCACIHLMTR